MIVTWGRCFVQRCVLLLVLMVPELWVLLIELGSLVQYYVKVWGGWTLFWIMHSGRFYYVWWWTL